MEIGRYAPSPPQKAVRLPSAASSCIVIWPLTLREKLMTVSEKKQKLETLSMMARCSLLRPSYIAVAMTMATMVPMETYVRRKAPCWSVAPSALTAYTFMKKSVYIAARMQQLETRMSQKRPDLLKYCSATCTLLC